MARTGAPIVDSELLSVLTAAVQTVIPNAVVGSFRLTREVVARVPATVQPRVSPYIGWSVFCYAVPITDEGLWVWHHHGDYRSLLANYVLLRDFLTQAQCREGEKENQKRD